jgi:hypothetical protein
MRSANSAIGAVWLTALSAAIPGTLAQQPGPLRPTPYLFVLDLEGTPLDEFPESVKALSGVMTVVDKDGRHMLRASSPSELLITLPQALPPVFTVEVDLIPKRCCNPADIMVEGMPTRNRGVASAELTWHPSHIMVVGGGGEMYQSDMPADLAAATPGNLTHLVMEFNGTTIRLYTNGQRLYTLEKQFVRGRVLRVGLGGESSGNPMYLAGLRVGSGPAAPGVIAAAAGLPGGSDPASKPPAAAAATTSAGIASTGTIPGGSTVRPAGTGTIATATPAPVEAITTIQPQTGTATPMLAPNTPKIAWIRLKTNTSVEMSIENAPEQLESSNHYLQGFIAERRLESDPTACPADITAPADPGRCYRWRNPWAWIEDWNLEPGGSYVYRVVSYYDDPGCYNRTCYKYFSSLPVTFTTPSQLIGRIDRAATEITSVAPRNVAVTRTSKSTARVSWTSNGLGQANPQAPDEIAWGWIVDRWNAEFPSTCSSVASGWHVDETNCQRSGVWHHYLDDWLSSGITYEYRVTSIFTKQCNNLPDCVERKYYLASPVRYETPQYFLPERPMQGTVAPVPVKLFLQAKLGNPYSYWGCAANWGASCGFRKADVAWAPYEKAAGYVISLDELSFADYWDSHVPVEVRNVAASAAPGTRFELSTGKSYRVCLGIVGDLTVPPDPRKGECIEISVEP